MKKKIILVVFIFLFSFAGISSVVYASTQRINVSYDNELNSRQPDAVKSTSPYINIGHRLTYGDETMYYVGKLNLGSVDRTKIIQKAVIKIGRTNSSWDNDSIKYNLDRLVSGWDTSTVTWNNAPIIGADPPSQGVKGDYGSFEFNVTDLVKGWVNGGPNFFNDGFRISKAGGTNIVGNVYASFASSNYPVNGLETRPYLEITYAEAPVASAKIRVTSFSPSSSLPGSKVFIYGVNLDKVTNVIFFSIGTGEHVAVRFSSKSDASTGKTYIEAFLPSNMSTGRYTVKVSPWGDPPTFYSAPGRFTVIAPRPIVTRGTKPTISFFSPTSGLPRSGVTIYGANFGKIRNVILHRTLGSGKNIEYRPFIKFVSDTQITFTLPPSIPSGRYTVKVSPWGDPPTFYSAPGSFTVTLSRPTVIPASTYQSGTNSNFTPIVAPPVFAAPSPMMFTRNMWRGMRGNDVKKLQELFNSNPELRIAELGLGSPGNETNYYGFLTMLAVQNFQCKYKIICSGSSDGTGYGVVGPQTRIKLQEVFGRTNIPPPVSPSANSTKLGTKKNLQKTINSHPSNGTSYGAVKPKRGTKSQKISNKANIPPPVSPSANSTNPGTAKKLQKRINQMIEKIKELQKQIKVIMNFF